MAAGLGVAAVLTASCLVYLPPGTVAVVSWRGGGTPRLLDPGFSLRVPLLQRLDRYPGGAVRLQARLLAASREGTGIGLPYRAELRPEPQRLLELHREGGQGGAVAALQGLVEAELKRQAAARTTYDLASGVAMEEMGAGVRRALEDRSSRDAAGLTIVLDPPEVPAEVRASFEREAIFGRRQETGARVVLIGIDGADWDIVRPMIDAGQLPNLARLKNRGSWARLRSFVPTLSPILWTTVATGKAPDRHGINDFLVADPRTGKQVLMNSEFRRVRALWNILSEAGMENDVIAWWATWPAESIRGHLVSDRVAYSTFNLGSRLDQRGDVHPADYAAEVERLRVQEEAISFDDVSRYLHISPSEFRAARSAAARPARRGGPKPPGAAPPESRESINVFVRVLAATETYRRVALDLLDRRARAGSPARLFAVYFQGVDEVNHRFAHCAPPRGPLCGAADYARFKDAVPSFYRRQDEILGEILRRTEGADVLVISDHGFASGANRPQEDKPFIEGKPGLWHDLVGIFVAAGPHIRRGEAPTVTLYDIAPTVLRLLGLPVPEDMPGKVLDPVLLERFTASHPPVRVPSYEGLGGSPFRAGASAGAGSPGAEDDDLANEEIIAQLKALGYVGAGQASSGQGSARQGSPGPASPASPGVPTPLYHANLGATYLTKGLLDQAEAEFRKALELAPRSPQALTGLAMLQDARGEPERALETLRKVVEGEEGAEPAALLKLGELFVRLRRPADGVRYMEGLGRGAAGGGQREVARRVALGMLYSAAGRAGEAEKALLGALAVDPSSELAMQELFPLYDSQGRSAELEPRIRSALARQPRSPMLHNWLGLVLKRRGELKGAESEFRTVIEADSERAAVGAMANLGSLYLAQGRVDEAVAILKHAVEKDPRNLEARTNLIVALGSAGDLDGARAQVQDAGSRGQPHPLYYNALAYVLHLHGLDAEALQAIGESLRLDPRQPDPLRLRDEIERGGAAAASPYR